MKFLLTFILAFSLTVANSQKLKMTSTNDLVMDCMKTNGEGANKQMAIWVPYNFWEIVGEQMKASPEFVENIVTQMKDYMMFCVVDYTTSSSGINFKTDAEIRTSIKLIDSSKNVLKPLEDKEISEDAKRLLKNLQPIMAQMLGQFGEGMQIYLFKAKRINGKPTINVLTKNDFTLSWNTTSLNWKLPLASMLPSKFCPVDNEKMKGNWQYCPIHGTKLDK
ncbi:MAG: hypothetical protein C0459_11030 [Chitinophaga sp.]|jgi:hypothetical protein|nr:hypothetical protein [Chitinophaga sp.]